MTKLNALKHMKRKSAKFLGEPKLKKCLKTKNEMPELKHIKREDAEILKKPKLEKSLKIKSEMPELNTLKYIKREDAEILEKPKLEESLKIKSENPDLNMLMHIKKEDAEFSEEPKSEKPLKAKTKRVSFKEDLEESLEITPTKKRKRNFVDSPANKKKKILDKGNQQPLAKKGQKKNADVAMTLKMLWEELRCSECKPERKEKILGKIEAIVKGRVKEFVFAHDTVRVLECAFAEGNEKIRSLLFEEVKDDILTLAQSKYGKFLLLKILNRGSKNQKTHIINAIEGHILKLIKHTEGADVVELIFNECSNAAIRYKMVQEFYGSSFRFFKESDADSLSQLFEKHPEMRKGIIDNMKTELFKIFQKPVIKHSIVHYILLQFLLNCDHASRSEMIDSLQEKVPEILHTKDGYKVALHCVWHGNQKNRKVIIKSMRTFVAKIAMEEHGHMVLLAIFDCVDDTRLIDKFIISELRQNMKELAKNIHARKVLLYLVSPRDPHFFCPAVVNILKTGDQNEHSKKDHDIRCNELKSYASAHLISLIASSIADMYKDNKYCLFSLLVLKHSIGEKREAYQAVSRLLEIPYDSENKNIHVFENNGSYFMVKQLILNDKEKREDSDSDSFSEVLTSDISHNILKSWIECNRGAFLLVSLIETDIPAVVQTVKEALIGCNTRISKKLYPGAKILLKKLKQ